MNATDYLPICEHLVGYLTGKFPGWTFSGSVVEAEKQVLFKINYVTPTDRAGTMYFRENQTPSEVLEKLELVKTHVNVNN